MMSLSVKLSLMRARLVAEVPDQVVGRTGQIAEPGDVSAAAFSCIRSCNTAIRSRRNEQQVVALPSAATARIRCEVGEIARISIVGCTIDLVVLLILTQPVQHREGQVVPPRFELPPDAEAVLTVRGRIDELHACALRQRGRQSGAGGQCLASLAPVRSSFMGRSIPRTTPCLCKAATSPRGRTNGAPAK